jgi:hypothetical protein
MEPISIYVKTSALGKTGIHWRYIESQEHQPSKVPSLLKQKILNNENKEHPLIVNDLLDVVKPSLLIFRDGQDNKLLLEVTGIESPKRSERMGRKVLNSIVFITDDEQEIRKIAYSALENMLGKDKSFSQMIQDSIDFYGLEEFRVDLDKVHTFIKSLPNLANSDSENNQETDYKIDFYSEEHLQNLANYLKNHPLPEKWNSWNGEKKDGVLVLVTDTLEEKTILHEVGVWRGFAKNWQEPEKPEKENQTQQIANLSVTQTPEFIQELPGGIPAKKQLALKLRFLVIIVLILTILLLMVVIPKLHKKNLKIDCQNITNCYPQEQTPTPTKN